MPIINQLEFMRLRTLILTLICVAAILMRTEASLGQAQISEFFKEQRAQGTEMDSQIIKEFTRLPEAGSAKSNEELLDKYESFRRGWLQRMVENIIMDLEIDEDGAEEVRKNPDMFYLDYDTYKLLNFR